MSLVTIYRWEGKDGVGPYQSGIFSTIEFDTFRHPPPTEDPAFNSLRRFWKGMHEDYIYGFESIEAMYAWFDDGMIEKMLCSGMALYAITMNVSEVTFGEKQVMFRFDTECYKELVLLEQHA